MSGRLLALSTLALLGALGSAAPALPQDVSAPCRLCGPEAAAVADKPSTPVRLDVSTSLNFDRLILDGAGNGIAEIRPDGVRSVAGSVTAIGARAMVGEVVIHGEAGRLVRIQLPEHIELQGLSGGSIRLDSIRSNLPPMPRLDENGRLAFRFGGILRVSGDLDGDFRGDVVVEVDYF